MCEHQLASPEGFDPLEEYQLFSTASGEGIQPLEAERPSGYYFGDGSGGTHSKYPTLCRAGVGAHYVDEYENYTLKAKDPKQRCL